MANIIQRHIINDGARNTIVRLTAKLDTSDESYVVKLDPALLARTGAFPGNPLATLLNIVRITADISDGLTVNLWWDTDGTQANATLARALNGRLDADYHAQGGTPNNATSPTGKIFLSTVGWQTGSSLTYDINLWVTKTA